MVTVCGEIVKAITADPSYRLSEADFESLGDQLLELPLGDPWGPFFGAHRHLWLRDNSTDTERVETINRNLLEELGLLMVQEIDLDW